MKKLFLLIIFILSGTPRVTAGLVINEIACGTSADWVELFFTGPGAEKKDISNLYVTMYYGNNEKLGTEPITIYSYDRAETPYDDRYVVIHLTEPGIPDETDFTGDTNQNGAIDIYCNNYSSSLWNSDGVVAIDSDDDPDNGGIIDFVFYSNRDGSPNSTIETYVSDAQRLSQWQMHSTDNIQDCSISIGPDGLTSHQSISRNSSQDTNRQSDFAVTNYQTPGRQNFIMPLYTGSKLIRILKKKISIIPGHELFGSGEIPVFIFYSCNIRFRIFSITGALIYESPHYKLLPPGLIKLQSAFHYKNRSLPTGLYLCKIEATSSTLRKAEEKIIYIILSRYR